MKETIKKTGRGVWVMVWLALGATWPFLVLLAFMTVTSSGKLELGDKYSVYFNSILGFSLLYIFIFSGILKIRPIVTTAAFSSTIITTILVYLVGSLLGYFPQFW